MRKSFVLGGPYIQLLELVNVGEINMEGEQEKQIYYSLVQTQTENKNGIGEKIHSFC